MGSAGTAPKRNGEPEETARAVASHNSAAFNHAGRVEQLLAQLEAKSLALVSYSHWNQPQAPAKRPNHWVMAAVLGCLWVASLALAAAYFSYTRSSPVAGRDGNATPLVISPPSDRQERKTAESVNRLTKALVNSSNRLNHIEAVLQESKLELERLKAKAVSEGTQTIARQPETLPVELNHAAAASAGAPGKANQNTAVTVVAIQAATPAPKPSLAAATVPVPPVAPKTAYPLLSVKPTDAAIPHKAADGTIDYWLVARGVFKELNKVQPIAIAAEGVVIHSLEDGKNYTLTRQGEWRNAEW